LFIRIGGVHVFSEAIEVRVHLGEVLEVIRVFGFGEIIVAGVLGEVHIVIGVFGEVHIVIGIFGEVHIALSKDHVSVLSMGNA